jgi:hypothetical protein
MIFSPTPKRCTCVAILGAAVVAAGHHSPSCSLGQRSPVSCFALPPEQAHGNHEEHRPIQPTRFVASIVTTTGSTIAPP